MSSQFGRIGVLMGGPSCEREISLKSGSAVYEALKARGIEAIAIDIKTQDTKENIGLLKESRIDCAFVALHGKFGEDGGIQAVLEMLQIPYTGSGVEPSRLAMDKIASRSIFEEHGLNVPKYALVKKQAFNKGWNLSPGLDLPLVIKPATSGSSMGLSIIADKEQLPAALEGAFAFDEKAIIEEYIEGRELTVGILEEQPLAVIEIIPKRQFFDYVAKYQAGMTEYRVPADLDEALAKRVKDAALSAHKLLGCFGSSRVDIILNRSSLPVILEVNTIPGLTSTSLLPKAARHCGIEFDELCLRLIRLAYEKIPAKSGS